MKSSPRIAHVNDPGHQYLCHVTLTPVNCTMVLMTQLNKAIGCP